MLVLIWDNASRHIGHKVRTWIKAHNRSVLATGSGVRILVCQLPTRRPRLSLIEPKWVHGKRRWWSPRASSARTN